MALDVACALKRCASRRLAPPALDGLGSRKQPLSCNWRKRARWLAGESAAGELLMRARLTARVNRTTRFLRLTPARRRATLGTEREHRCLEECRTGRSA